MLRAIQFRLLLIESRQEGDVISARLSKIRKPHKQTNKKANKNRHNSIPCFSFNSNPKHFKPIPNNNLNSLIKHLCFIFVRTTYIF